MIENLEDMYFNAMYLLMKFDINRYLMSCAEGRWDGAEKAERHTNLCQFFIASLVGVEKNSVDITSELFESVHKETQKLTDNMDKEIGFPLVGRPDYKTLQHVFFQRFMYYAMDAAIKHREDIFGE